jgi:hypothetical protein
MFQLVDECMLLVLLLNKGESIIRSVGIFFSVDNTAGWAWGNVHGLSLSLSLSKEEQ